MKWPLFWLLSVALIAISTFAPADFKEDDANAQNELGLMYAMGVGVPQDYAEAVKWFRKAAEQGLAFAQYNLGLSYDSGKGVPQDYAKAAKWYRMAAKQGFVLGQYNLGVSYCDGRGVPKDEAEAAKWFRMAAEQGFNLAQYNLGFMYSKGQGVPRDYVLAYMWLDIAASRDIKRAATERDRVAADMTAAEIAEAQRMARAWRPKAGSPSPQDLQAQVFAPAVSINVAADRFCRELSAPS